ncbi:MAG TPA: hypothetical protein DEF82_11315 [Crocinitomicaceae bacterium]|nr:hypothetical protein [Crocinitomicaceae bacterium]
MKSLVNKLEQGITKIENGAVSSVEMDELVQTAREVHERLLVVRYKLYEQQVFPERIHTPIDLVLDSFSNENNTEIEKPIDFDLDPTEEELIIEVSSDEDLATEDADASIVDYTPNPRELVIDTVVEKPIESDSMFELPLEQDESNTSEAESEHIEITPLDLDANSNEEEELEESASELTEEPPTAQEEVTELSLSSTEFNLSKVDDQTGHSLNLSGKPLEFKNLENAIAAKSHIEKLETLIGSFTLNDKLLFINSLFDGSSDAFAKAVKSLESTPTMSEARIILSSYADEFHWEMDNDVVEDFVHRICQRHADTLDN